MTDPELVEITHLPELNPEESTLLDLHSVLNVLNVLACELQIIGYRLADNPNLLRASRVRCELFALALRDPARAQEEIRQLPSFQELVFQEVNPHLPPPPLPSELGESIANLHSVFAIFAVRAGELLDRAARPGVWERVSVERLRRDFLEVFSAIEKNSHGRYRIIYNAALQEPRDYYVDFRCEGVEGDSLLLPPAFTDVMRDLIANARKYTDPGGRITAALHDNGRELRFVVVDTGCGIPEAEIREVVLFGRRGSNVQERRTMGGGFGLTKAYHVTRRLGGRFWIASRLDQGTTVRLWIPRPD